MDAEATKAEIKKLARAHKLAYILLLDRWPQMSQEGASSDRLAAYK